MTARISELRRSITEDLPATEFVGGFPKEQISVLASAPGTGKTWFVLKSALDLSMGGDVFCGFAKNQAPAKSVIMCGEGGFRMLTERRALINKKYDASKIAVYTLSDLAEAGVEISLDTKDGSDNLAKIIKGEKADICYIDSLIAFRDEDESKQGDTSRVLKKLITIARKCNCAIVATHHTRKRKRNDNGATTQDDIIGSSAITRLAASAWTMTRDDDSAYTTLRCVKTWFLQPETIYWRLATKSDGTVRFERATGENVTTQKERALKQLVAAKKGDVISIGEIIEHSYVEYPGAQAAMEQFAKSGYGELGRDAEGNFVITITK